MNVIALKFCESQWVTEIWRCSRWMLTPPPPPPHHHRFLCVTTAKCFSRVILFKAYNHCVIRILLSTYFPLYFIDEETEWSETLTTSLKAELGLQPRSLLLRGHDLTKLKHCTDTLFPDRIRWLPFSCFTFCIAHALSSSDERLQICPLPF